MMFTLTRCSILCAITAVLAAGIPAQQDKSCEARLNELERRLSALERQAGISSQPKQINQIPSASSSPVIRPPASYSITPGRGSGSGVPISVTLLEKTLMEAGPGEDSDRLGFSFEFRNSGKDHITSFNGRIIIKGPDGENLQEFQFDIAKYITVGATTRWFASIPFSSVNQVHRMLYTTPVTDLELDLRLRQVMYYDTRVEEFD